MDKPTFAALFTLGLGAGVTLLLTIAAYIQGRRGVKIDQIRVEAKKRIETIQDAVSRGDDEAIQRMLTEEVSRDEHGNAK